VCWALGGEVDVDGGGEGGRQLTGRRIASSRRAAAMTARGSKLGNGGMEPQYPVATGGRKRRWRICSTGGEFGKRETWGGGDTQRKGGEG